MLRKEWAFYPEKTALKFTLVKDDYMQQSAFDEFYDFQRQITSKWLFVHICVNSNEKEKGQVFRTT